MEYVSPAAVEVLGYPIERWLEDVTFWERIVHPEDADRVAEVIEHVNATGDPLTTDYRVIAMDGRTVWLHEEARLAEEPAGLSSRAIFALAAGAGVAHGDHMGVVDGIGCRHL